MDAGLAAVLGALAGSTATIGAALATGWAQREGARITARSEHRRERRQPRHDIYKEFIAVATEMRSEVSSYSIDTDLAPADLDIDHIQRLHELMRAVKEKSTDAALAGPKAVTEVALGIEQLGSHLVTTLGVYEHLMTGDALRDQRMQQEVRKHVISLAKRFEESLVDFTLRAQAALDDDGSQR